jgi:ectoine hydrolase
MLKSRKRFTDQEYLKRLTKTRKAMQGTGIELLIVTDPSNMYWLTGYDSWSFYVHQCVVVGLEELFWFGRIIDAQSARLTTSLAEDDIIDYPDDYVMSTERHPMDYLSGILKQRGLDSLRIGVEKDNYYFSASAMEALNKGCPQAQFSDATGLVNWQRAIKSEQELIYMKRAGEIIEKVYQRVLEVAQPGMRKNELAAEILHAGVLGTEEHFGDYTAIVPLIGSGEEAAACHMTWDNGQLQPNSGTFLELAGAHARYHCPCSRTLYFGNPPDKYRDIEKVIAEGIDVTLEQFKPGNSCGEVATTFFNLLKKYGYEKDNRCGYPIGLSYPPDWGERTMSLRTSDTTIIQPGMCFHFMPGMWFDDWGFEMTESVTITENGAECLSSVPRELLVKP